MPRHDHRAGRMCQTKWDGQGHEHICMEVHSQKELDRGVNHECVVVGCSARKWEDGAKEGRRG